MTTKPSHFGLEEIGQIAITVKEIGPAVKFYRDVLCVPFLFEVPDQLAFFRLGNIRLMLGLQEAAKPEWYSSILYFKVPDIEAAAETLEHRGVKFESSPHFVAKMPDHELWMAFFRDPDQNLLGLMCEKR